MKRFVLCVLVVLFAFLNFAFAGYTAEIVLTDSIWQDIGNEYPAGTADIYVEVYDPDVTGSLDVTFSSDSDSIGEVVTLSEVLDSPGLFRGSIAVDFQGTTLLSKEDEEILLPQRIEQLRLKHSDWDDKHLEMRARSELVREAIERPSKGSEKFLSKAVISSDDLLQITTGDVITVTYEDQLNDYGNVEEITDQAVYGGWTGSVSGTWTKENSPYVITGDIYVDGNQSLTIEPGVEVRFFGNYGFYIYGDLSGIGTEQDSILFTHHLSTDDSTEYYWQGLCFYWGDNSSSQFDYCKIEFAERGVYVGWSDVNLTIEHSHICYSKGAGLYFYEPNDSIKVVDCLIEYSNQEWWDNAGIVVYYSYQKERVTISNTVSQNNRYSGIYLGGGASGQITGCDFTNNNSYGVQISDYANFSELSVNECNIYDNSGSYDVYVYCCDNEGVEIDMMNNFWGETTTAEMNEGGNPKNISRIYDWWDENNRPVVNYAGWLQNPAAAGISLSIDELISSPGDTVLVGLNVTIPEDTSFISSEITISGYSGQLEFIEIVTDSSLIGSAEWSIQYNETDSLIITASAGADGITGEGVLFWLRFAIPDTASGFIPIILESAIFNTGDVTVKLHSGGINVLMDLIVDFEGTPLMGVYPLEVNFTDLSDACTIVISSWLWTFGDGDTSCVQNPTHTYSLPGNYTVSLTVTDTLGRVSSETKYDYINVPIMYGDVDFNTLVQAYDAGMILQYLVEYIDLNDIQLESGNVSLDTSLSALDASIILQYIVGLIDSLPYDTSSASLSASGLITMNDVVFKPGESIALPLYLHDGDNILSFEGKFTSDPEIVSLDSIIWSGLLNDFVIEATTDSGEFTFAAAGLSPDGQEGLFATVYLTANEIFEGDSITISLEKLRFNEEPIIKDITVILTRSLSTDDYMGIPTEFAIKQNYPNPFNPTTTIEYDIPKSEHVKIEIFDIAGRLVGTLVNKYHEPGRYSINWNVSNVGSGLYIYRITAGRFTDTKKCILLK